MDFDAFLDAEVPQAPEGNGAVQTFIKNAAQGALANFGDEIDAGITAAKRTVVDGKDFKTEYGNKLAYNRTSDRRDAAQNPKSAIAGQVAGGIAGAVAMPASRAATTLGRVAQATTGGAAFGATSGAGAADGDLVDRGLGAVEGGALGAAGGLVGGTLGEVARKGIAAVKGAKTVVKSSDDLLQEYVAGREALKAVDLPAEAVQKELVDKAMSALKYENASRFGPEVKEMLSELRMFGKNGVNANYLEGFRQDLSQLPSKFSEPLRKVVDEFYQTADLPAEFRTAYAVKRQGEILGDALTKAGGSLTKQRNALNKFLTSQKGLSDPVKQVLKEAGKSTSSEQLLNRAAGVMNMAGILGLGVQGNPVGLVASAGAAGLRAGANKIADQGIETALEAVQSGGASVPAAPSALPSLGAKAGSRTLVGKDIGEAKDKAAPKPIRINLTPQKVGGTGNGQISDSFVKKLTMAESGGNPRARPIDPVTGKVMSSAFGPGQFIMSTWLGLVDQEKPAWAEGLSKREILAARADPEKAKWGIETYAKKNQEQLEKAGVKVDDGALYLAHFLDAPVAIKLLKADPETPAYMVTGMAPVRANPKALKGKKAKHVIEWAQKKVA